MKWLKMPTVSSVVLEEKENSLCKMYISFNKAVLWHHRVWQKVVISRATE